MTEDKASEEVAPVVEDTAMAESSQELVYIQLKIFRLKISCRLMNLWSKR